MDARSPGSRQITAVLSQPRINRISTDYYHADYWRPVSVRGKRSGSSLLRVLSSTSSTFHVMEDGPPSPLRDVVRRRLTVPGGGGGGGGGALAAERRRRRLVRRSDPGLSVVYDELTAVDSGWDLTASATTSCGVARSSSLRNSFLRTRAREPIWIQSTSDHLATVSA